MQHFRQGFVGLKKKLLNLCYVVFLFSHHRMIEVVFFWLYAINQALLEQYRQFNTISAS